MEDSEICQKFVVKKISHNMFFFNLFFYMIKISV